MESRPNKDDQKTASPLTQAKTSLSWIPRYLTADSPMPKPDAPTLLSLPVEVLLQIVGYLKGTPEPSLAILRALTAYFSTSSRLLMLGPNYGGHVVPCTCVLSKTDFLTFCPLTTTSASFVCSSSPQVTLQARLPPNAPNAPNCLAKNTSAFAWIAVRSIAGFVLMSLSMLETRSTDSVTHVTRSIQTVLDYSSERHADARRILAFSPAFL